MKDNNNKLAEKSYQWYFEKNKLRKLYRLMVKKLYNYTYTKRPGLWIVMQYLLKHKFETKVSNKKIEPNFIDTSKIKNGRKINIL